MKLKTPLYLSNSYKLFKPLDIAVFLVIALSVVMFFFLPKATGKRLEVFFNGDIIYTFDLSVERDMIITKLGNNRIVIKNGSAYISESDCKNHICQQISHISNSGETIICAPNKLVLYVSGDTEYDAETGGKR